MRALSILFVVINIYWFCYGQIREWGINIGVVDRILLNFDRTAGLFRNILWTKLFAVVFLALSCLGTKGVKEEKITWRKITASQMCIRDRPTSLRICRSSCTSSDQASTLKWARTD